MDILTVPNDILNKPTRPVTEFDENLRKTVRKMEEMLKNQRDPEGVGLSANQIGLNLRLAVVRLNPEESDSAPHFLAIANPKIVSQSPTEQGEYEACLSVPNQYGMVERASAITVQFQGLKGETLTIKATGFLARIFQHEIDHLDGKLITERSAGPFLTESELEKLLKNSKSQTPML
ncbi:MAG: peptide deformylase [candidate division WWE3 bacterium]|nr:peptide deformylase [candidate division WWE3 bacterium]